MADTSPPGPGGRDEAYSRSGVGPITSLANYCQVKEPAAGFSPARAADLGAAV